MAKKRPSTKSARSGARGRQSKTSKRSPKKKPAARTHARRSGKRRPAGSAQPEKRRSPRRSTANRSAAIRKTVDGYVATLNDWRKQCVAQLRRIMRGVELPDPRKLLKDTGKKVRHIKLRSLKEAGLKELQELVRLASSMNEIKRTPGRRTRPIGKRK